MFLEAETEKLISRYKESRRAHPLNENGQMSLMDSILEEKQLLSNIRTIANYIVDTTQLTTKELKARVKENLKMRILNPLVSMYQVSALNTVYKNADLVFDVRFLPNPYYVEDLRPMTGEDEPVYHYVMKWKETEIFFEKLMDLLKFMIPGYKKRVNHN